MRRHFAFILGVLLFALSLWAQQIRPLTINRALPGANGTMGVSHDTSGTTYINLQVKHLAGPEALRPAKAAYVVWVQPPGQPAQNHGVLEVNDKAEARYSTTTKDRDFELFVTAEDKPDATTPTGPRLMSAHN